MANEIEILKDQLKKQEAKHLTEKKEWLKAIPLEETIRLLE